MLADISIANLGVITSASVELSPGLTVLTGETGAGKTMVVTGLRLLSGGRAEASRVRTGAKQAIVDGHFLVDQLDDASLRAVDDLAEEAGFSRDENGEYLASRTVSAKGRSRAHLGGRSVPAATLQEFAAHVLTIHGQNDQLRLTSPDEQLAALDRYDPAIGPLLVDYRESYQSWRKLAKDLKQRTEKRRELAQEVDQLKFAIDEIDKVGLVEGEDDDLSEQIRRLQDVDALRDAVTTALGAIDGADALGEYGQEADPASTLLGQAHHALSSVEDSHLAAQAEALGDIVSQLSEISATLGNFLAQLPADPQALEKMLQRQQDVKRLTRKYADDVAGVLAWRTKAQHRLNSIDTSSEALEELKKQVAAAQKELSVRAARLTKARKSAAKDLAKQVTTELHGLAMPKARIEVAVEAITPGRDGADAVELRLAPNETMKAQPLAQSASGGELSRVMLALEVILSSGTRGVTMVFDEVDAGVGGRAAVEIGRRLARLATHNQVIVVTHLPQVAAYADTHLHVAKNVGDETVTSGVESLSSDRRIEELARMLAGLDDTDTGRAHAAELFERAQKEVHSFR